MMKPMQKISIILFSVLSLLLSSCQERASIGRPYTPRGSFALTTGDIAISSTVFSTLTSFVTSWAAVRQDAQNLQALELTQDEWTQIYDLLYVQKLVATPLMDAEPLSTITAWAPIVTAEDQTKHLDDSIVTVTIDTESRQLIYDIAKFVDETDETLVTYKVVQVLSVTDDDIEVIYGQQADDLE
jgi:hypothetical protein